MSDSCGIHSSSLCLYFSVFRIIHSSENIRKVSLSCHSVFGLRF